MFARLTAASLIVTLATAPAATAGQTLTPGRTLHGVVGPHDSSTHPVVVFAGLPLTISVRGAGASDLDIFIYDDFGTLLASSTDISDQCALTISPERPGVVRVEVRNGGGSENAYTVEVS